MLSLQVVDVLLRLRLQVEVHHLSIHVLPTGQVLARGRAINRCVGKGVLRVVVRRGRLLVNYRHGRPNLLLIHHLFVRSISNLFTALGAFI